MAKRAGSSISSQPPRKKTRCGGSVQTDKISSVQSSALVRWTRDSRYYYEDGSVTLLVEDVLFKIQASLLKAHSEVFGDMFSMPSGDNAQEEGACDCRPIIIPGVKASEFRNLMKMVYSPASDPFFVDFHSGRESDTKTYREFLFCSDVARLSHRFCMPTFEKWANRKLTSLLATSTSGDSSAFRIQSKDRIPSVLLKTLAHAKLTSNRSMEHELRHTIQHYSIFPHILSASRLLELMHTPGIREEEPALFGFWFLLLLNLGHENWQDESFTKQDRIALFSAQAHLTPAPKSLGKGLFYPLFAEPKRANNGYMGVLKDKACSEKCLGEISNIWYQTFDHDYYEGVASNAALTSTSTLCDLPGIRSDFASAVRRISACKCTKALARLDEDITRLFTKVAAYYQDIS